MTASKRKILLLFLSSFVGVLLVHLASTLPFYVIISGEIAGNETGGIPYASFLARAVRFAACAGLCWMVRGKGRNIDSPVRQRAFYWALACLVIFVLLCLGGQADRFFVFMNSGGILYREGAPLITKVLWEQIFTTDLAAGVLLGFVIVACPGRARLEDKL